MPNIDPFYLLFPVVAVAFSFGLVVYWHYKRSFSRCVLLYSLVAYAGAIALKYLVQIPTLAAFDAAVGGNTFALGAYYGLQTVVFEVGGAYVVARYAVSRGHLGVRDAEGYGIGLAMWENGVLIGLFTLINWVSYYVILSGSSSFSQLFYDALSKNSPALFYSPTSALPVVVLDILERVSSLLVHFSWGYLCVLAVVFRRKLLLAAALPMGLVDFFVPFASSIGAVRIEILFFVLSVGCLVVALTLTKRKSEKTQGTAIAEMTSQRSAPNPTKENTAQSLTYMIFKRSVSYGKVYLIIGLVLSFIFFGITLVTLARANVAIAEEIYPLALPLAAIMGSLGGLMIFTADRTKGVYEYLIAYGIYPSAIFWSVVLAALALVSIILVVSVSVSFLALALLGKSAPLAFLELLIFYSLPLSYASSAFMTMAGMIWASLSTRRTGLNSPVGAAPMIGLVPVLIVFYVTIGTRGEYLLPLVGAVSVAVLVALVGMAFISDRKMDRERFLSNV